ncbi:aminotransferase class III-fold pyridoxal phosphate-dependent enzyme [Robiginitalea sediminis]|uniref:aminotransferase class III-fold pyridoxal phosphate-dependent enzyme n=1 Tax=Robiginitalea sediminis TaxID=1982593 RepID=UPI000B4ACB3A|nr:aminotransferase class III-fold pyridoxal phosphate-dependent enzyme [Robiginitalea sediminis]
MEGLYGILETAFGVRVTTHKPLEGYQDRTTLVTGPKGKWILKVHETGDEIKSRLALEARLMEHYSQSDTFAFPKPLKTLTGNDFVVHNGHCYRLLEFLEGSFLAEADQDAALLESFGELLGTCGHLAATFNGPGVSPPFSWDLRHLPLSLQYQEQVSPHRTKTLIAYFAQQFETHVVPKQYSFRTGFIHNDANDWNVLTYRGKVTGLIDFGDACHSWLAADLAVGMTYALMGKEDPMQAAESILKGYARCFTLEAEEADILYLLIAGRLCISLCQSTHARKLRPDSEYVSISEAPARELLEKWVRINPLEAQRRFRAAAGLAIPEASAEESYAHRRNNLLSPAMSLSYSRPIVMKGAALQYMYGHKGETYLDAYNNIMLVGHCHPEVTRRTCQALRTLNTNTRYHFDALPDYAEALLGHFPPSLNRVFLVNSGSAATDLALRLARAYTGKSMVMALEHGYHGNTIAGIAASPYKHSSADSFPETLVCPMPKVFGSGLADDGTAGAHFSSQALKLLSRYSGTVGAFLAEPIMGCGGQVPLPKGYLEPIYRAVRAQGGLCISDEVQVGFGRLGPDFWGFNQYGVVPDMVILGKPMGNGHPIGAVVCTREIAEVFAKGPEFFSSFGGNPVSCAAGHAVLDALEEEDLPEHASAVGTLLKDALTGLQSEFSCIADVRGNGLFLGVELLEENGAPATALAGKIKNRMREAHVLLSTDGPGDNVLKIKPPLPFNRENSWELIDKLRGCLKGIR